MAQLYASRNAFVLAAFRTSFTGLAEKWDHKVMAITLSNLDRFSFFFAGRFLGKFAVKWILKVPLLLAYVATLPCETLTSENKRLAINYKVVVIYLTCGGVVNNQIKKGLLLSLSVKISEYLNQWLLVSYKQERGCLARFLRFLAVWWPHAQRARTA